MKPQSRKENQHENKKDPNIHKIWKWLNESLNDLFET